MHPTSLQSSHSGKGLHQSKHLLGRQGFEAAAIQSGLQPWQVTQLTSQTVAGALPSIGGLIAPPGAKNAQGGEQQHDRPHELAAVRPEDTLGGINKPEDRIDGHKRSQESRAKHRSLLSGRKPLADGLARQNAFDRAPERY